MNNNYIIKMPGRYYQGRNYLNKLGKFTEYLGKNVVVLISRNGYKRFKDCLNRTFKSYNISLLFDNDIIDENVFNNKDFVVVLGGGSIIDLGKYYSNKYNLPLVVVPTVMSSDAACTSMVVPKKYTDRNTMLIRTNRNPEIVLVDTQVLLTSPIRFVRSGIGDALSKFYEARSCHINKGITMSHGDTPDMLYLLANDCTSKILTLSKKALESSKYLRMSDEFEEIVLTCIYESGIISDNCGLSIAHAFSLALDEHDEFNNYLHGEKVSYGVLFQLFLESYMSNNKQQSAVYFKEVYEFNKSIGLPVSLNYFKLSSENTDLLKSISKSVSENKLSMNCLGKFIDEETLYRYLLKLNSLIG